MDAAQDEDRRLQYLNAASRGDIAAVTAYLDQGMDVDAAISSGDTALMRAAGWGRLDVIQLLLDRGADTNRVDANGYSAVTYAIEAARGGRGEALAMLLAAGGRHQTLPDAVWSGDVELARSLLDAGADVDFGKGWTYHGTMLQVACGLGDLAMVELFLARGADVNEENDIFDRPLTDAAQRGHIEIVRRLLDHGADIDVVDQYGMSALSYASERGDRPLYDLLIARGAKVRMFDALNEGDLGRFEEMLDEVLREGRDIDSIYGWGGGRLAAYATEAGDVAALRMALDRGAAHYWEAGESLSLLGRAAKGGHVEAMELLIARGADLNFRGCDGLTPLGWAEKAGQAEAVALLKRAGALR